MGLTGTYLIGGRDHSGTPEDRPACWECGKVHRVLGYQWRAPNGTTASAPGIDAEDSLRRLRTSFPDLPWRSLLVVGLYHVQDGVL